MIPIHSEGKTVEKEGFLEASKKEKEH